MLETGFLAKADPARGRFRAFLKTALRHFLRDRERRRRAERRGGTYRHVSLEGSDPDAPRIEVAGEAPADARLDDVWRRQLVERALDRLAARLANEGRARTFDLFRDYFLNRAGEIEYTDLAERHGLSQAEVSNALMRAKRGFASEVRRLVVDTVTSEGELEEEITWLLSRSPV